MSTVAPWDETPLFEQILFFFTDLSTSMATDFLSNVLSNHDKITDEKFIWDTALSILPSVHHNYLKGQIEIGFFQPRGEMYREMAKSKGGSNYQDVIIIGEKINTDGLNSVHYLPSDNLEIEPFELQFGTPKSIVYANLRSKEAGDFVLKLIQEKAQFSLRPTSKTGKFGINLRGFGIEMRPFKYSMEYGVKDSFVLDAKKDTKDLHDDPTVKRVDGLPESYYDVLEDDDFQLKLTAWIAQHKNESLPEVMRDLTNNYPLFINEILKATVSEQDEQDLEMLGRMRENRQTISSINGRQFNIPNLDIFNLLDVINRERSVRNVLSGTFKLNDTQLDSVFGADIEGNNNYRFDSRSDYVHYFNDVENDEKFKDWSKDLGVFYRPLTKFPKVRRNLIQYIVYTDPTTIRGLSDLYTGYATLLESIPVKLGIIPCFNLGNSLSRKVAFAFHHLAKNVNDSIAVKFLLNAFEIGSIDPATRMPNKPTEAFFRTSYEYTTKGVNCTILPWSKLYTLYSESEELNQIVEEIKYMNQSALEPGTTVMNGHVLRIRGGIQEVMYEAQQQIMLLGRLIPRQRITNEEKFDSLEIIGRELLLVKSLDHKVLSDRVVGLGVSKLPIDRQLDFVEFLKSTEWDIVNKGRVSSYYMLFCNESTDTTVFREWAENTPKSLPAQFAINPKVPESLRAIFPTNPESPVLIVNGRVYKNINISNTAFLDLADKWSTYFVYYTIAEIDHELKTRRLDASCYLQSLVVDWRQDHVIRRLYSEKFWTYQNSLIYVTKNSTADVYWDLAVNPLDRNFQRIAGIIAWIEKMNIAKIRMCIVLPMDLKDYTTTLTTFYRNAIEDDLAVFTYLNDTTTYSAMPDMPLTWVTESMRASTDLDNILLSQLNSHSQEGVYILTNILLEGSCLTIEGDTAEGTELALTSVGGKRESDTIAMMNGYFQLQANPGIWNIELGGSRSNSIYSLDRQKAVISSFASNIAIVNVKYRPGKEGLKVTNISSTNNFEDTDRVDVFSVASGHLYERLLKIMMLTVRTRSKYNVKFWLIKNFLSPTFKATLPIMAKQYNFSYQLISYKWPIWLRQQVEKQRIIWGNKILFLDTIFPLDLDRVIYVDADQIVRTDLIELMRMDFHDAPYAFTPMCNSREETEKFRFWKQGYWLEHLRGKPYHISALFAIDLRRIRQMGAGDLLRYHYQQLSADPGSLANLDQDLPNYAQDEIPIFSLPQEWLWCQTWCSDETMETAKTIDLCNNPLTKSPKLEIAQNRIEEWPHFDEIARNITASPDEYQKQFFHDE
jgi:UDP-glucose:glycoprotein glucosyltransferase